MSTLKFSPQQTAVLDWVSTGRGSTFIEAVAGAGKTTTLIYALARTTGTVAFAAFNKKIADEIKARLADLSDPRSENYDPIFDGIGNRVRVGTFHSFGFGAWRYIHKSVKVDARSKADMTLAALDLDYVPGDDDVEFKRQVGTFVLKLISLAKQRGIGLIGQIDNRALWWDIVEHFDLAYEIEDPELIEEGIGLAIRGLRYQMSIAAKIIDFDDMIYMPVVTGCKIWANDWIFVDEAQDTNPARRALARKMVKSNGRAAFVGDRHQAIYGFTGADNDAVDQIIRDFRCNSLPLTTTYRCPKAVVAAAQEVVSHIEAHESAPEGSVSTLDRETFDKRDDWTAADAILCRKTAPLVEVAYSMIRRGIPCHVEGKDIGIGILKLVNRYSARSVDELREKLEDFCDRETQKLIAKGRETQAEALGDRVQTVFVLMEGCQTVKCVTDKIVAIFLDSENEPRPSLTLSTVHKAKGREWDRVFVLGRYEFMPSKWARQDWQMEQEENLIYVAYTRAKSELFLVG